MIKSPMLVYIYFDNSRSLFDIQRYTLYNIRVRLYIFLIHQLFPLHILGLDRSSRGLGQKPQNKNP